MLHEYGYGYPIQYVSDTRIRTLSKENPLNDVSEYLYPRIRRVSDYHVNSCTVERIIYTFVRLVGPFLFHFS
jgi:hypothetical protein